MLLCLIMIILSQMNVTIVPMMQNLMNTLILRIDICRSRPETWLSSSVQRQKYSSTICRKKFVTPDHYFCIPKNYDYVDKIVFYDKKLLPAKVDEILEQEEDTKIVIFCNSYNRVMELFKLYGDKACYFCSKNAKALSAIRNDGCIYKHEDGSETFDKRILVTTKVLDNGINIKDKKVKHIFCEILDVDSAIQALGRKRQISDDDTCTFYIKDYTPQAIQGILNTDIAQVEPVKLYKNDYDLL